MLFVAAVSIDPFAERLRAADLDRYLATLYAPAGARRALFALHALDLELLEIVRTTSQPTIGLIRLAWWREALETLDRAPPPAQPLLRAAATHILPLGVTGAALAGIEAGFAALIEEPVDVAAYLDGRGLLFAIVAALSGGDAEAARGAGRIWAAGELLRLRPAIDVDVPPASRFAGAPRPLIGLAALARRDLRRGLPADRGTPSRQFRLLWSIMTGR